MTRDGTTQPYLVVHRAVAARRRRGDPRDRDGARHDRAPGLEEELSQANVLRQALVESSLDAILVLDEKRRVLLVNRAAEQLLGVGRARSDRRAGPRQGCSPRSSRGPDGQDGAGRAARDLVADGSGGEVVPVRVAAVGLEVGGAIRGLGGRSPRTSDEIKQLEREKLDAERLAAVGQTVAGLAHGIKNILTGLEGGMYVTSSGLKKRRRRHGSGRAGRCSSATWRGSRTWPGTCWPSPAANVIEAGMIRPGRDRPRGGRPVPRRAAQHGDRCSRPRSTIRWPRRGWTPRRLHSCLANLISNAIDACLVSAATAAPSRCGLREDEGVHRASR